MYTLIFLKYLLYINVCVCVIIYSSNLFILINTFTHKFIKLYKYIILLLYCFCAQLQIWYNINGLFPSCLTRATSKPATVNWQLAVYLFASLGRRNITSLPASHNTQNSFTVYRSHFTAGERELTGRWVYIKTPRWGLGSLDCIDQYQAWGKTSAWVNMLTSTQFKVKNRHGLTSKHTYDGMQSI